MENPIKIDDLGGFTIFLVQHPYGCSESEVGCAISYLGFEGASKFNQNIIKSNEKKGPWLFRGYRGLYYPVMWGL